MNHSGIPEKSLIGYYAGFFSRLLAFIIDTIIISFSLVATTWFFTVTATMLQFRTILGFSLSAIPGFSALIDNIVGLELGSFLSFIFVLGYHVFFLVFAGQTPGKALLGLRVVPLSGGKIPVWRALVRFLAYFPSALLIWIGFLWIIVDDRRQAWHDKLAGTCVIYTWDARPDERFLADEIRLVQSTNHLNSVTPGEDRFLDSNRINDK
jgi:uncharacterized RDD family membrane protein YckC